jgi:hypothetical protein
MAQRLPKEVVQFLLDNPDEVKKIQDLLKFRVEEVKRKQEYAEKRKNAKMVPCGTYGCTELKNEMDVFCPSCYQDYLEDPDAYK